MFDIAIKFEISISEIFLITISYLAILHNFSFLYFNTKIYERSSDKDHLHYLTLSLCRYGPDNVGEEKQLTQMNIRMNVYKRNASLHVDYQKRCANNLLISFAQSITTNAR